MTTMAIGIEGGLADASLSNVLSRVVEDSAGIAFALPVKAGANDGGCTAGIAAGDFIGLTVADAAHDGFAQYESARVLEKGAIWLKAGGTISDGDQIMCTTAGVYTKYVASTASNFKLDGFAETSATSGGLFKFYLRSNTAVAA